MRNFYAFGAMTALILGLSSCSKSPEQVVTPEIEEGTTYMSVRLNTPVDPRAEEGGQYGSKNKVGDWAGNDAFTRVDIYMITPGVTEVQRRTAIGNGIQAAETGAPGRDGKYTQTPSWKTTAGKKTIYVVINATDAVLTALDNASNNAATFPAAYRAAYEMYNGATSAQSPVVAADATANYWKKENGKDKILFSAVPVEAIIADGVSAGGAMNHATNNVNVEARRIETRTVVTMDQKIKNEEATGIKIMTRRLEGKAKGDGSADDTIVYEPVGNPVLFGTLKNVQWTVAQYEKQSYLLAQTELSADGKPYAVTNARQVKTPGYDYVPTVATDYYEKADGALQYYDYSQLKSLIPVSGYTAGADGAATVTTIANLPTKSLTETTHKWGKDRFSENVAAGEVLSGYVRANTPYIMVKAVFVPDQAQWAPGQFEKYKEGSDIHWGTADGYFYAELDLAREKNAANAEKLAKGEKFADKEYARKDGVVTYRGGATYYFAYLNPDDTDYSKVINMPVLRNNIYHVNITGFKEIGASGNSRHPGTNPDGPNPDPTKNPDLPDPDDPKKEDPTTPPAVTETFMQTTITVVNWGVHTYNATHM